MTLAGVLIGGAKPWYQLQRERTLPASPLANLAWSVARPISAAEASAPQDRITPGGVRPIIAKKSHHTFAAKRKRTKDYSSDSSGTERETGDGHVENRIYRAKGESYDYFVFHKGKKITFGDSSMPNRNHNDKARENFNSRHSCDTKKDKSKAGYWACRCASEAYVIP